MLSVDRCAARMMVPGRVEATGDHEISIAERQPEFCDAERLQGRGRARVDDHVRAVQLEHVRRAAGRDVRHHPDKCVRIRWDVVVADRVQQHAVEPLEVHVIEPEFPAAFAEHAA